MKNNLDIWPHWLEISFLIAVSLRHWLDKILSFNYPIEPILFKTYYISQTQIKTLKSFAYFVSSHSPYLSSIHLLSLGGTQPVWPDWAIYGTLGYFLKPLATINLPKSPTFLGNFCKGVKIYHFSNEIIFGQPL